MNTTQMEKNVAIIGLGKMGKGLAEQLLEKNWTVWGMNRSQDIVQELAGKGLRPLAELSDIIAQVPMPRVVWLMLPAKGGVVDEYLFGADGASGLVHMLSAGDVIIDGGNSNFNETVERGKKIAEAGTGVEFMDAGISGGPAGARNGACSMIGGSVEAFAYTQPIFEAISAKDSYAHFPGIGAGHFVKMVHNGIEYGMMQAIGEGFGVMEASNYNLDLKEVTRIYQHGSVIESRLVGWMQSAFEDWGVDLARIDGAIQSNGEGEWTVNTAKEMGIEVPIIEGSVEYRKQSMSKPNFISKCVSALRGQFGGHPVFLDDKK